MEEGSNVCVLGKELLAQNRQQQRWQRNAKNEAAKHFWQRKVRKIQEISLASVFIAQFA